MTNTLLWAEDIRNNRIVRAPFGHQLSAMIHEADIAAVAVKAPCEKGHEDKTYLLTSNEELTRRDRIQQLAAAIGTDIRFEELTTEEAREQWLNEGYSQADIDWLLELGEWECISPATDSIEQITGHPARTFYEWAKEHADYFR